MGEGMWCVGVGVRAKGGHRFSLQLLHPRSNTPETFHFSLSPTLGGAGRRGLARAPSRRPLRGLISLSLSLTYSGPTDQSSSLSPPAPPHRDWEVRLLEEQRTLDTLKQYVSTIYAIIKDAERMIRAEYPVLAQLDELPDTIHFVTAEELHSTWPDEDVHGRENKAVQQWGAIFIVGMGWPMRDGSAPEEVRAPDYDDWTLNGDIMVRGARTGYRHELSSMGVRVNAASLAAQLKARGMEDRTALPYHQGVLRNTLPLCIGGGIGISRLLMHLLGARHIGQVQVGVWADRHHQQCAAAGIALIPDRLM